MDIDKAIKDMSDEEYELWLDEYYNIAVQAKLAEMNLMNPANLMKRYGENNDDNR